MTARMRGSEASNVVCEASPPIASTRRTGGARPRCAATSRLFIDIPMPTRRGTVREDRRRPTFVYASLLSRASASKLQLRVWQAWLCILCENDIQHKTTTRDQRHIETMVLSRHREKEVCTVPVRRMARWQCLGCVGVGLGKATAQDPPPSRRSST